MKLCIAGSRNIEPSLEYIAQALGGGDEDEAWHPTHIISGGARGADRAGEDWAFANGVPVVVMPAQWGQHGKKAGPIRNKEMATEADALLAFWDGVSSGTAHMIATMRTLGKPVRVVMVGSDSDAVPGGN